MGKPTLTYARESRDPNVKMVLFEDSAALIGIAVATIEIALNEITGATFWDPLASVLIGLLLVTVAIAMGRDAKHLLIGSAARPEERKRLEEVIEEHQEIVAVDELLTMVLGPKACSSRPASTSTIRSTAAGSRRSAARSTATSAKPSPTSPRSSSTPRPAAATVTLSRGASPLRRSPLPSRRTCGPSRGSAWPT